MKQRKSYKEESEKLAMAIDIAIEAYEKYCPKEFETSHLSHTISCYLGWKKQALDPEQQFRTLISLKYIVESVFTYFQEATGETVEYFWKRIEEEKLDYKRENRLKKILDRGKIKGRVEYDYVVDMILVAQQVGLTSVEETKKLSVMIQEYEIK